MLLEVKKGTTSKRAGDKYLVLVAIYLQTKNNLKSKVNNLKFVNHLNFLCMFSIVSLYDV